MTLLTRNAITSENCDEASHQRISMGKITRCASVFEQANVVEEFSDSMQLRWEKIQENDICQQQIVV